MPKQIIFEQEAREAMQRGVRKLARAVKATLGPCGRNVAIRRTFGSPNVTKDGVTVAREIELPDPFEDIGAQMVKEVASKTSEAAGDGTTTATVYAEAIFEEGLKNVAAGAEAMELKRGINAAVTAISEQLHEMKIDVSNSEQITQVGTCAANQDPEIGKHIAFAMDKVGKDGVITVEESQSLETTVDLVEGMQFDKGYLSQHFVTNQDALTCELEKPYILVCEEKILAIKDILPILETILKQKRPILIIAETVENEAIATLVVNRIRGNFMCCAVKSPGFGERRKDMLMDIAALVGGNPVMKDTGLTLEGVTISDLGSAKKVTIDNDNTTMKFTLLYFFYHKTNQGLSTAIM